MAQRYEHLEKVRGLALHALGMGATLISPSRVRWDVSGKCARPRYVERVGRIEADEKLELDPWGEPRRRRRLRQPGGGFVKRSVLDFETGEVDDHVVYRSDYMVLEMLMKCRQCEYCLKQRANEWKARAKREVALSERTWFFTLTLSPEEQLKASYTAELQASKEGLKWHELVSCRPGEDQGERSRRLSSEQFKRRHDAIGPHIQTWLKRVRKESGAKFRYLIVAEAHKSGLPHYHGLIHEVGGEQPVRKRTLQGQWKLGFSQFRLVEDDREAAYVCKYLSKSVLARVRASNRYGKASQVPWSETEWRGEKGAERPTPERERRGEKEEERRVVEQN